MAFVAGEKLVASAATPEALAGSTTVTSVVVQAKVANTKTVMIGTNTTQKVELPAGASVGFNVTNLNLVFVKVQVNNEGVNYLGV
ncbi:MAG: hypothetical protein ABI766_10330 [Gemmatimonadales bacterium]